MISEQSFTKDWLDRVNKTLEWNRQEVQFKNLEKAIAALYLVEQLSTASIPFIFKGGTSLLLLLGKIFRLSVDVDLILEKQISNIEDVFTKICIDSKLFFRFEKQIREKDSVFGTEHYLFHYRPFADDADESHILLDLYYIGNPYAQLLEVELISEILRSDGENVFIRMPDTDSILGDKLTAFAPETIGIPLLAEPGYRPKRVEVLKQLYDIGNLFDHANNVSSIRTTYRTIALHEIQKLGLEITCDDTLGDCLRHAYIIGHGGKIDKQIYGSIAKGYKDFNKFVSDLSFDENHAILAAAKTAYLVKTILGSENTLEKYDRLIDMSLWEISDKYCSDFNEYKYSNPEAFFYWFKALHSYERDNLHNTSILKNME